MRLGRYVLAIAFVVLFAFGWLRLSGIHDIVVHERQSMEWTSLALMRDALADGHAPGRSDAAAFVSTRVVQQALDATVTLPRAGGDLTRAGGDLTLTVLRARALPKVGHLGVALDTRVADERLGMGAEFALEGDLAFRCTSPVGQGGGLATARFAVSILRAEPKLSWGTFDLPGRRLVSEVASSGLMVALDDKLVVEIPFNDRLAFDAGFHEQSLLKTDAGSVTVDASLPGKVLERRFTMTTPLFLRSGVWLVADASATGQGMTKAPSTPRPSPADLGAAVTALRATVADAVTGLEQDRDLVFRIKGEAVASLVNGLQDLPVENRTISFRSVATAGQLASSDVGYVELTNPNAATAQVVVGVPKAEWIPGRGVSTSTSLDARLDASVKAQVNVIKSGTTVGLVGKASKTVGGVAAVRGEVVNGHSVATVGIDLPCDSLTAELRTDGKLVVGPLKTDVPSLGIRWTLPVPRSLGQASVIADDVPRRIPLHVPTGGAVTVRLAHPGIEYATKAIVVSTTDEGFVAAADVVVSPVDDLAATPEQEAQRREVADGLTQLRATADPSCHSEQHMSLLVGSLDIGPNGEVWKRFASIVGDVIHGPGPSNDLVGRDGVVATTGRNVVNDLKHGPGEHNEITGRKGVVRRTLGF